MPFLKQVELRRQDVSRRSGQRKQGGNAEFAKDVIQAGPISGVPVSGRPGL